MKSEHVSEFIAPSAIEPFGIATLERTLSLEYGDAEHLSLEEVVRKVQRLWQLRQYYHREEKSLTMRVKSICRRFYPSVWVNTPPEEENEEEEQPYRSQWKKNPDADRLYDALLHVNTQHPYYHECHGAAGILLVARQQIAAMRKSLEKSYIRLAQYLPGYRFCLQTPGASPSLLAALYGEAAGVNYRGLLDFGTPYRLFMWMGIAKMPDHTRQRRVTGQGALQHRYVQERRALLWTYGQVIIRGKFDPFYSIYVKKLHEEMSRWNERGIIVLPAAAISRIKHIESSAKRMQVIDKAAGQCYKKYPDFYPSSVKVTAETTFRNMARYRAHCKRMMEKALLHAIWQHARSDGGYTEWDYSPVPQRSAQCPPPPILFS